MAGAALLVAGSTIAAVAGDVPAAAASGATPVLETKLVGYSVHHRPIVAYHLGKRLIHPIYLLVGQMHGDEHAGVTLTQSMIGATHSVERINLWVIPTMNPDGDAAHTRQNGHNVDLNRNWPNKWTHLDPPYYSGPEPLSEPETQAMWNFLWWLKPDYLVVLHQPLHGVDTTDGAYLDPAFRDALARNLDLPKKAFLCGGVCHGSMTGWYTAHHWGVDETIEFGSGPTKAYLTGQARDGILSAMHGRWGALSTHNPLHYLTVTPESHAARVLGWTFDPDFSGTSVSYDIVDNGRVVAHHTTAKPSPTVNAQYDISGTHKYEQTQALSPGEHTVCVRYDNLGAGTGNPEVCRTVGVPA